ncbi:hypothetical protein KNE206_46180 [Kitasatospora sp. NE20-6]|uniref:LAGLIDADG family homing endonuclease n=1 Tax=Kitasatospora sp. NE20-6 TaxID=2859066 RepID=UPI0034DBAAA4
MNGFDLENPDHAYMFGFLQADGHLSRDTRNRGRVTVELSAGDAPLLEAFQRLCPCRSTLRYRTRATNFSPQHSAVVWSAYTLEFRRTLEELGMPAGRKSAVVAPPRRPHAERDYLRGLVDADGSLGRAAQDLPFVAFTTASEALVGFFLAYTQRLTGGAGRTVNRNRRDGVFNAMFTNEDAVALAGDLYYPGCLALPRKAHTSERVVSWIRPAGMRKVTRRSWTAAEDGLLLTAVSAAAAAADLGRTVRSCTMRRRRLLGRAEAGARRLRAPA